MTVIAAAPVWLLAFLALAVAAAAIEDAWRLRISNVTVVAIAVGALIGMGLAGFPASLWQNLVVCAALLVLGTMAFGAGWVGGGDVKLLAALGLWTDIRGGIWLIVCVCIAGGLLALASIAASLLRGKKAGLRSRRIPYGIAIAAGVLFAFGAQRPELQPATKDQRRHLPVFPLPTAPPRASAVAASFRDDGGRAARAGLLSTKQLTFSLPDLDARM